MKRLTALLLSIVGMAIVFASCQKAPELTLSGPTSLEISADGGSSSITFTANRDWKVSSSDSWVSVSPSSGTASDGTVTVSIRCNENTTYDDRSATVTIRMEELSQTVTVRQPANLGIVLPKQLFDLQANEKKIEVEVQANVQYTVSTSADWIKQAGTKALTSKTITFSIEENKTFDPREGKITIKPQNATVQEQVITVRQAQKDALNVEKTSYDMPYGGGEIEIKVEANVAFDVTPDSDWLHYVQTKGLSSSTVCITVDENTTYSAREGKIEIAQKNGSLKHTISVKQAGRVSASTFELNKTEIQLRPNTSEVLTATIEPYNATDKDITWTTSDPSVATVDENGKVIAINNGTATISAKTREKEATCYLKVCSESFIGNPVDLGVAITRNDGTSYNLKWADCNLGASHPEEFGNYYAWGETETKNTYTAENYKWYNGGYYSVGTPPNVVTRINITKYCLSSQPEYWDGEGNPDNKTTLDPEDDAVQVKLGGAWRMPTYEELEALIHQCSWTWTTKNGFHGYEVKSKSNGNTVFFPATGVKNLNYDGLIAGYFASSLSPEDPARAGTLLIRSSGTSTTVVCYPTGYSRELGCSIRPVTE